MNRTIAQLCLLAMIGLSLGCVERRLMITSEPSGALVYLNEEEAGRTPLEVPFTWYGTYDVRVEREGYQTLHTQREAERPWWEAPGPDLFAEAVPNRQVEIAWHLVMQEAEPLPEGTAERREYERLLIIRAQSLRELNRRD